MGVLRFLLPTILHSAIIIIPIVITVWFKDDKTIVTISLIVFVIFFLLLEFFLIFRPQKKIERTQRNILDFYFGNWVDNARLRRKQPQLRISVLLKKRHYFVFHFFQYYQFNMEEFQDCNLHFSTKVGFAGECLIKDKAGAPYLCDLRKYDEEDIIKFYKFDNTMYEKTKHIKAIACVPLQKKAKSILRPDVPKYKTYGIFCVDAVDELGADFLAEKKVLQEIKFFSNLIEKIYTK